MGDSINALLCGMGHNLKMFLVRIRTRILFLLIWQRLIVSNLCSKCVCCGEYPILSTHIMRRLMLNMQRNVAIISLYIAELNYVFV